MLQLYRKNSFGVGVWRVDSIVLTRTRGQILISHSSVEGGALITHVDPVETNGSGRSIEQQVELEVNARVSRQLDKGYKRTREEALQGPTNQLGLAVPMLAQKISDVKLGQRHFDSGAFVQPKFDGHRCLITKQGGEMVAYSRRGKPIMTVPHVLECLEPLMGEGDTCDGELYIHGRPLQALSSLIKRDQPESKLLTFRWYDVLSPKPYNQRLRLIHDLQPDIRNPAAVQVAETVRVDRMAQVYDYFKVCRRDGYEGAMLRLSTAGYEAGKRSDQLLKVKERDDCEVTVVGCRPSATGWAILRARTGDGKEFDISAPGSVPEKTEVLRNFESKYRGRRLTVEYANLTSDGLPFHAVAVRWHEDL